MFFRTLISLCTLSVAIVAAGNTCRDRYTDLLSGEQLAAIDRAQQSHSIYLMEGVVDGKKRLVVMMGEVHIQDQFTYDNGRAMVQAFPARALEQYPGGLAWRALKSFAYWVEGMFSGRSAGSSITYAREHLKLAGKAKGLVDSYKLEEKSVEELDKFRYHAGGVEYSGHDLLALKKIAPRIENLNLEKDYVPNEEERLAAWAYPTLLVAPKLSWIPALGAIHGISRFSGEETIGWLCASALCYVGTSFAQVAKLDHYAHVLRPRRDAAMAGRLVDIFSQDKDRDVVLTVVGRNHLGGIREELEKKGFQWVQTQPRPR